MPVPLLFLDTETTGLDPERHEIWEVAAIRREVDGTETDRIWHLPVDLGRADPIALSIGRFHERYTRTREMVEAGPEGLIQRPRGATFVDEFMRFARGCHIVGAIPSFDDERLRKLLRSWGGCETWHYHIIDVEALAVGYLGGGCDLPWKSDELSRAVGVDPEQFDRHTAMGDVLWAKAIFDMIVGPH